MVKAESCVDLEGSHLLVMRTGNSNTAGGFILSIFENRGSEEE